jgi:hypothetical protein
MNAKALLIAAAVLTVPAAALAHHGWSGQEEKLSVLEGPIQSVRYLNPHGEVEIIAADKSRWTITLAPLSRMQARGLTKEKFVVGQTVRVEGHRNLDKDRRELKANNITIGGVTTNLLA